MYLCKLHSRTWSSSEAVPSTNLNRMLLPSASNMAKHSEARQETHLRFLSHCISTNTTWTTSSYSNTTFPSITSKDKILDYILLPPRISLPLPLLIPLSSAITSTTITLSSSPSLGSSPSTSLTTSVVLLVPVTNIFIFTKPTPQPLLQFQTLFPGIHILHQSSVVPVLLF